MSVLKRAGVLLLGAAALTGPLFAGYMWFTSNYIVLSKQDAQAMFMLIMACLGGVPPQ